MKVREVHLSYKGSGISTPPIRQPFDAVPVFVEMLPDHVREHFLALYLDVKHVPIGCRVVATGTADGAHIHPRDVFQPALALGACALIIAHNHPSGDTGPSAEDRQLSRRLKEIGLLIGIPLLDSLVIAEDGKFSQV
jgi:DNA repair protein RadC